MSIALTVAGATFDYPQSGDSGWGEEATNWAAAVTAQMLTKSAGSYQITAELDFGALFGLKTLYYKSRTANPASAGQIRLARVDTIKWRNEANSDDVALAVNSSNQLTFGGTALGFSEQPTFSDTSTVDLTLNVNDVTADVVAGSLTNTHVNASAAIALSKLAAVTASRVLTSDASGFVSASGVTTTTLGYLDATSSIQTQLDAKAPTITVAGSATQVQLAYASPQLSATLVAGGITNTEVNASAAIALSKLAATTASRALVSDSSGFVSAATTTSTEIGYVNGVTSAIQTQINAKITAGAGAIGNADVNASAAIALSKLATVTASRALVSDASGFVSAHASTTSTEIGYVSGVTSAIQTQINNLSASAGAFVFLTSYAPSSAASVNITSQMSSTYDSYLIRLNLVPASDDVSLLLRTDDANGASFDASAGNYSHQTMVNRATAGWTDAGATSATAINLTRNATGGDVSNDANCSIAGWIRIDHCGLASSPAKYPHISWHLEYIDTSARTWLSVGSGSRLNAAVINAVQLLFSGSVNIASGAVEIWGSRLS